MKNVFLLVAMMSLFSVKSVFAEEAAEVKAEEKVQLGACVVTRNLSDGKEFRVTYWDVSAEECGSTGGKTKNLTMLTFEPYAQ